MESITKMGNKILSAFLDVLYPRKCIFCGRAGYEEDWPVCEECGKTLEFIEGETCGACGRPGHFKDSLCRECMENGDDTSLDGNTALMLYNDGARELIHHFKYNNHPFYAAGIAALLFKRLDFCKFSHIDIVTGVPLHSSRLKERGFNQAGLLAKELSKLWGVPLAEGVLVRNRPTEKQSALNADKRALNVAGAFSSGLPVWNKKILIVDDIYTTGATLKSCGKALKAAGAAQVLSLTVAVAPKYGKYRDAEYPIISR